MRGELRLHIARGPEGRVVEHGQILAHGARRGLGVDRLRSPVLLRRRILLVGIRLDQAGVHGEAIAADQALGDAPRDHRLEEMPEEVAFAEAAVPVLGEGRVVGHPTGQVEPAEPAGGEIEVNLLAEPPLGPDTKAIADQEHPYQQLGIDRRTACRTVERRQPRPKVREIDKAVDRSDQMVSGDMPFEGKCDNAS